MCKPYIKGYKLQIVTNIFFKRIIVKISTINGTPYCVLIQKKKKSVIKLSKISNNKSMCRNCFEKIWWYAQNKSPFYIYRKVKGNVRSFFIY